MGIALDKILAKVWAHHFDQICLQDIVTVPQLKKKPTQKTPTQWNQGFEKGHLNLNAWRRRRVPRNHEALGKAQAT